MAPPYSWLSLGSASRLASSSLKDWFWTARKMTYSACRCSSTVGCLVGLALFLSDWKVLILLIRVDTARVREVHVEKRENLFGLKSLPSGFWLTFVWHALASFRISGSSSSWSGWVSTICGGVGSCYDRNFGPLNQNVEVSWLAGTDRVARSAGLSFVGTWRHWLGEDAWCIL